MVSAGVNYGIDLAADIAELKRERNAVILAHNYQVREIQEAADFVGDSLGLSYEAAKTDADVILFCGVHFMAETAKTINPSKRVILPDLDAGCSLSESCPPPALAAFLKKTADKNYYVIAYINCSAGVKALSDVICTSGNAEKIVKAAPPDRNILFVPDQNLGAWVMEKTGRKMDLWRGLVTCTSSLPPAAFEKSASDIPALLSLLTRNAQPRCECWPMKFAPLKKWSPFARNHRRAISSSLPKQGCSTACVGKFRAKILFPARRNIAPVPNAGS